MEIVYTVTIVNDALSTDSNNWLYVDLTAVPVIDGIKTPHAAEFTAKNDGTAVDSEKLAINQYIAVAQGKTLVLTVSLTVDASTDLGNVDIGLAFNLTAGQTETK